MGSALSVEGNDPIAAQEIPIEGGETIVYQPYASKDGILQIKKKYKKIKSEKRNMPLNQEALNKINPVRIVDVAELQNNSLWTQVRPRPVYVNTGAIGSDITGRNRIGLAIVIAERVWRPYRRSRFLPGGFAIDTDGIRLFCVRKVASVDPSLKQVPETLLEVPQRRVQDNIERAILVFRPDSDSVQMIQQNGETYDEPWSTLQDSKDARDLRAIEILRMDFPEVFNYIIQNRGEKKNDYFFERNRRAVERRRRGLPPEPPKQGETSNTQAQLPGAGGEDLEKERAQEEQLNGKVGDTPAFDILKLGLNDDLDYLRKKRATCETLQRAAEHTSCENNRQRALEQDAALSVAEARRLEQERIQRLNTGTNIQARSRTQSQSPSPPTLSSVQSSESSLSTNAPIVVYAPPSIAGSRTNQYSVHSNVLQPTPIITNTNTSVSTSHTTNTRNLHFNPIRVFVPPNAFFISKTTDSVHGVGQQ